MYLWQKIEQYSYVFSTSNKFINQLELIHVEEIGKIKQPVETKLLASQKNEEKVLKDLFLN